MALSDQLAKLSVQAKRLEDSAAAASSKNKEWLAERESAVRADLDATKAATRAAVQETKDSVTAGWHDLQQSVSNNMASLKTKADKRRAEHKAKRADRAADNAEIDAENRSLSRSILGRRPNTTCWPQHRRGSTRTTPSSTPRPSRSNSSFGWFRSSPTHVSRRPEPPRTTGRGRLTVTGAPAVGGSAKQDPVRGVRRGAGIGRLRRPVRSSENARYPLGMVCSERSR